MSTPSNLARDDQVETGNLVELSIPVRADLIVLARLTASTIAGRAGFALDEIEDLRLAVEELCLSLVDKPEGGRLHLTYIREEDAIQICCSLEEETELSADGLVTSDVLSRRILDALVDEHGRDMRHGHDTAWLRKRRTNTPR
jgi:hypothetical protein